MCDLHMGRNFVRKLGAVALVMFLVQVACSISSPVDAGVKVTARAGSGSSPTAPPSIVKATVSPGSTETSAATASPGSTAPAAASEEWLTVVSADFDKKQIVVEYYREAEDTDTGWTRILGGAVDNISRTYEVLFALDEETAELTMIASCRTVKTNEMCTDEEGNLLIPLSFGAEEPLEMPPYQLTLLDYEKHIVEITSSQEKNGNVFFGFINTAVTIAAQVEVSPSNKISITYSQLR